MNEESGALDQISVLVVTGTAHSSGSCVEVLEQRKMETISLALSPEAPIVLDPGQADIVLVEDSVSEQTSKALLDHIRGERKSAIPVLFACDAPGAGIARLLSVPGTDTVRTPFVAEELVARIRVHAASHREQVAANRAVAAQREAEALFKLDEDRLESLVALGHKKSLTDRELIDYALEEGVRLTQSKFGYLHFVNEGEQSIALYTWTRATRERCATAEDDHYPMDRAGVWVDCVRRREPVFHNDYQNLPNKKGYPEGHIHLERHLSVPVFDGDRIVAIAGVGNKEEPYDGSDARQLNLFMNSMWEILERNCAEAALRRANDELEERVRERTKALRQANEALAAEIEERKRVEAALRSSEERYELATTAGLVGLWDLDLETEEMYLEPKLKAMLGFADHEIPNQLGDWSAHAHPDDARLISEAVDAYLSGKQNTFEIAHRMVNRRGEIQWFLTRGRAILDETGTAVRIVGTNTDITDRKSMEATIIAQKDFLNSVVEALSHPLYVIDAEDFTIQLANSAAIESGSKMGEKCYAATHGCDAPCSAGGHACPLAAVRASGQPVTVEHVHNVNGELREHEIHGYPLFDAEGNVKQMIEYTLDITPRKLVEKEIRRRNRELTLLNSVITASTTEGGPDAVMGAACRGLRDAFELRRVTGALFDAGDAVRIVAEHAVPGAALGTGRIVNLDEEGFLRGRVTANEPVTFEDVRVVPELEKHRAALRGRGAIAVALVPLSLEGEGVGLLWLEHDQPRRFDSSEIELALRVADQVVGSLVRLRLSQARRKLEAAIEQAADGIVITDIDGIITYVNPAFERVSGYERREAIGRKPSILKSDRHDEAFYQGLWETILAGQTWRGRFTNRHKSGALFTEDAVIAPLRDDDDRTIGFIASKRDVTRELELEGHIRQSQKMESIGRLAGGVAHDFNNLLAVILGYAGLALRNLKPSSPEYDSVKEIEQTAQRAAAVTRQLLTFARREVAEPRSLDLSEVLANLDRMLERIIGASIEMEIVVPRDLWRVRVDAGQFEQVIVNLTINARDAMPDGGRLVLRLANTRVVPEAPVFEGVQPGQYVELSVHDTGMGMTEEVKKHLFEPFFTTKDRERGTGLGLATCFGIVTQSEGYIWAESTLGEGTTVRILIPRTEGVDRVEATSPPDESMPQGTETVFVVEDEDNLRRLACQVLRQLGYRVLEAENGEVALRVAEGRIADIDLLVTDVVMPRMSGPELVRRLHAWRSDLPVIFTSGYARDTIDLHATSPGAELLRKPFAPSVLARAVRAALDARRGGAS